MDGQLQSYNDDEVVVILTGAWVARDEDVGGSDGHVVDVPRLLLVLVGQEVALRPHLHEARQLAWNMRGEVVRDTYS